MKGVGLQREGHISYLERSKMPALQDIFVSYSGLKMKLQYRLVSFA
jgi:hypothetical protein